MISIIGAIGSFLLSICSFPEVYRTIKLKKAGMGYQMLLMWFFGCVFSLIYTSTLHNLIVISSTMSNLLAVIIILVYKIRYGE